MSTPDVAIVGVGATPYYFRGGSYPQTIIELAVRNRAFPVRRNGLGDRRDVALQDVTRVIRIVLWLHACRRDGEPGHDECPERTENDGSKHSRSC